MPLVVEPDFEFTAQNMEELFSFMSIRFAAAAAGFDAKQMRLHCGVAPSEQLHTDGRAGLKDFTLGRTNKGLGVPVRLEHRQDIRFIKTRNAAECGDRRAHLAALESAEEADRDAGSAGDFGKREAAARAQTTETLAGRLQGVGGDADDTLFLENVYNRSGVQAAGPAKKNGALKQADVGFGVHAVAAFGAPRRDQAECFPGAEGGGRNAEAAGHLGDAQEPLSRRRIRSFGQILST